MFRNVRSTSTGNQERHPSYHCATHLLSVLGNTRKFTLARFCKKNSVRDFFLVINFLVYSSLS